MARFPVTKEGAEALHELSARLNGSIHSLEQSCGRLTDAISGLDELGDFKGEIEDIVSQVVSAQEDGRGSAEQLANKVEQLAGQIEGMLTL